MAQLEATQGLLGRLEGILKGEGMEYSVQVKEVAATPVMFVRVEGVLPETGGVIKQAMDEVWALVQKEGLELAGDCYCAYPVPKEGEAVAVDSVIPVRKAKADGRVQAGEQTGGLVAYTHHVGPYSEYTGGLRLDSSERL
jgi:effector-binding domain-containing protein